MNHPNPFDMARAAGKPAALRASDWEAIARERARLQVEQLEAIIAAANRLLPMAGTGDALACPDGARFVNALFAFTGCAALYDLAQDIDAPFGTMAS